MLIAWAPAVAVLCRTVWETPFPVTEAVAIFEDVANRAPTDVWKPESVYYRPLFYLSISAIWHTFQSLDARLTAIRLLHVVPLAALVGLFVVRLRPQSLVEAAVAAAATAVLLGSPGVMDNLELPLGYTLVAMPIAVIVWTLLERKRRPWHAPAVVALTLVAIGFKEQGLVLVPVVVTAWWTGARGASRSLAATLVIIAAGYVLFRVAYRTDWPVFEQAVGLGFSELEPSDAASRFGAFPYWVYAYNAAATISNVLFAEPQRGVFRIIRAWMAGAFQPWQLVYLVASVGLTGLIAWWGTGALRNIRRDGWSDDARLVAALAVALLACGVLSFSYSRARLGGMAVPFYAMAAAGALRAAAAQGRTMSKAARVGVLVVLAIIAAGWHARTLATIQYARATAWRNHMEWVVLVPERRREFADRPTYLAIMDSMIDQGLQPGAPRPAPYPEWVGLWIGQP